MKNLYYLASPFTHSEHSVMMERVKLAEQAAINLLRANIAVFSPISYNGHWINLENPVPGDWQFWQTYDKLFISKLDGLIVLTIDGWEKSIGVSAEIEYAIELGLPIIYLSMEDIQNKNFGLLLSLSEE